MFSGILTIWGDLNFGVVPMAWEVDNRAEM